ncbi:phosphoribosyltransferase [Rhizobium tubonense]|uniref:Phosphoribosyltransferase n=1 Tax=Rhizobium tubonense TaxID=484088 RepID=A0A2W4CJJ1_9HYPH|nr:phosphoribosyltransferase [Rhizobium tubonense]PZM11208.1 phosphoribosyltransferase [Rhizobium tubonense]
MRDTPKFVDRADAGRRLAAALGYQREKPIVLALPRGGVPVAFEIATSLRAPLDLLLVRKIGAPGQPECAIGAIVDGKDPQRVIIDRALELAGASLHYFEEEAARQFREIERRRKAYFGDREPMDLRDRNVILVDDGIATGATVRAGLKALRRLGVASVTLAMPVAPEDILEELRSEVDEVVCLFSPRDFYAVGLHYADFDQTSDGEVIDLLKRSEQVRA